MNQRSNLKNNNNIDDEIDSFNEEDEDNKIFITKKELVHIENDTSINVDKSFDEEHSKTSTLKKGGLLINNISAINVQFSQGIDLSDRKMADPNFFTKQLNNDFGDFNDTTDNKVDIALNNYRGNKYKNDLKINPSNYFETFNTMAASSEENNFNILKNNDLLPYVKAFAYVYYWIGNMMPVVSNPTSGVRNVDNWNTKLNIILSLFNGEELSGKTPWKAKWSGWISTEWKDKGKVFCSFCEENYLQDLYSMNEKNDPVVKDIVEGCNSIVIALEEEIIKKWFDNNTKIIIQRSYRIKNEFKEDWNAPDKKDDKENVKCIIKDVYKKAGFPGTEDINLF